jgi:hypothetical protein
VGKSQAWGRWMLIGAIGLLISGRSASAELPPTVYAEMQQRKAEVLQIEVLGVQASRGAARTRNRISR